MKTINLLFLIFFVFQNTPIFSMTEEEEINLVKIKPYVAKQGALNVPKKYVIPSNQEDIGRYDDDCCTHWGLKRWFCGIKEYIIDRCLCCTECGFNPTDQDRAWIEYDFSTDCCCITCSGIYANSPCNCCPISLYNNPITGTLCFPLAATMHLCSLPCACCSPNKDGCYGGNRREEKNREAPSKSYGGYSSSYSGGGSYGGTSSNTENYSPSTPHWEDTSSFLKSYDANNMRNQHLTNHLMYNTPTSPLYTGPKLF